ncbi:YfhD family protein [Pseudalkalibacillus caeni]|uniref:YfhD family protein n=1 Tax=Exobacillus caeni TaxID=2574798 RepID=A0A5R9EZZ8_9BACL|nr:YfhD family protein [Pseudalkalibacillus caeni]TLS35720.1 YfhD family protein [Pseudalkalibacillus caeni]
MAKRKKQNMYERNNTPIRSAHNEDVEYSQEMADADDVEAKQRAEAADQRQER